MADTKSASLKQTEIENSFTEMKAILEALRKEVSQINAGTSDSNQTHKMRYIVTTFLGLEMPLLKQCFHLIRSEWS